MISAHSRNRSTDLWIRKGYSLSELQDCPFCESEIPADDDICYYCGAILSTDPDRGVYTFHKAGRTWRVIKYVGIILVLLGLTGLYFHTANLPFGMIMCISGLAFFGLGRVGQWWCRS